MLRWSLHVLQKHVRDEHPEELYVLAVMVHQCIASSSDLSLDFRMTASGWRDRE